MMSPVFVLRVTQIAEALFEGADPTRIAWASRDLADFASRAGPRGRFIFALSVWVLTWIAPLFVWRAGPLGSLDLEERATALERLEASALGFAALGPKAILCMIWFEHEDTRRETGTEITCAR